MPNKKNLVDVHVYFEKEEYERLLEYKKNKYNSLPAMSKVIRDFVREGLARADKK